MIKNLEQYPIVREHNWNEEELIHFENKIVESWETGKIRGPVHLCGGNEKHLIEIFKRISETEWVDNKNDIVWCFIGDMTFETGTFMENYKYIKNFELPVRFVVEDNGVSTNTPTIQTWGKKLEVPNDVVYYEYEKQWPHYGTGKWVVF